MKKQFTALFEHKEIEYEYTAIIHTGDDAYIYPDRIIDLERTDREPLDDDHWEEVEAFALANAQLVEWCEKEGWAEEDTGGGCSSLIKNNEAGGVTRITRANDPSAPQYMAEAVVVGRYDKNDRRVGSIQTFRGGINEWIADPSVSRWSPYADTIKKFAAQLGRGDVNPRWIEAFMLLEYPSLNSISTESFKREVATAINCIDFLGPDRAEHFAQSLGL